LLLSLRVPLLTFIVAVAAVFSVSADRNSLNGPAMIVPSRAFEFTYQVHGPPGSDAANTLHLWIPLPQADGYQEIRNLRIESPVHYATSHDPEYGNSFAEFAPTPQQSSAGFDVTMSFVAVRHEHKVSRASFPATKGAAAHAIPERELQRYLEPDKLVPLNGVISQLAAERTAGDVDTLTIARHIYDYVAATMRYDKSGAGWGRGDAIWACTAKRGNCTDFHSLFIGMMRSKGIPARFEIGFPLPEGKNAGDIPGYHCWAEFYLKGVGWVPVDASEAWKNPAKRDYFFGAHDDNRVFFTYGRDIRLSSDQQGAPLNYFIYPYAEMGGQQ
jgi:transglutaminase-like putative cysteine protease